VRIVGKLHKIWKLFEVFCHDVAWAGDCES